LRIWDGRALLRMRAERTETYVNGY
jgi:hypothetical protein